MSIISEELVEEWLNVQGFFTIRGVYVGNNEMDLLGVRQKGRSVELWHYEVAGAVHPMNYISDLPKSVQKVTGKKARNASRRTPAQLRMSVKEWVDKKYFDPRLEQVRQALWPGKWHFGFVRAEVKHEEEVPLIRQHRIKVVWLDQVLDELKQRKKQKAPPFHKAAGSDLADLVLFRERKKRPNRAAQARS